ncbi:hypothetical protein ABW636_03700 [Aquimarina sp. 2201CG1-2-11]|uniref:hypothetical protein n=1 Tax=Aquimarina discodermiae TaxID=3231043 RepID=UPI003461B390
MDRKTNLIGYPIVIIITAILAFLVGKCQGPEVIVDQGEYPANGDPEEIISLDQVEDLYNRYEDRVMLIDSLETDVPNFEPTRAILFDYQEIKNYLAYIEKNASEANVRISGLRFYFGKYPNDTIPEKRGKQMLFYNPTIDTVINGVRADLAYAIERQGDEVGVTFLKDIIDVKDKRKGKGQANQQGQYQNEASILSFLNFNTAYYGRDSQTGQGGQHSPPPPGMQ